jgi:ABC-type polysaccharide/polyol phosphate transport system ATPase subunit
MKPAIEVHHVTKEYRLGAMQSLRQIASRAGARLLGRPAADLAPFKALDDVSFSVQPGEVVGVIGHNGAGKSTLLKILSRITTPTQGRVKVNGRVAPLIEVGAGFVGDMTGRENVYLNGAILGMSRKEIDRKFDEIVDFAEMAQFIDTPVKRYSSGMQVKLAFAVATSIESEILIVDEVLAVGDLAFQRKCFDRMEALIKKEQRTVLLVSHNIRQVERLCSRVLVMDHGRKVADSDATTGCNLFYEQSDSRISQQINHSKEKHSSRASTSSANPLSLVGVSLHDDSGVELSSVEYRQPCRFRLRFSASIELSNIVFGLGIHTPDMLHVAIDDSIFSRLGPQLIPVGDTVLEYRIARMPLLPGRYAVRVGAASAKDDHGLLYEENLCHFAVAAGSISRSRLVGQGFTLIGGEWTRLDVPSEGIKNSSELLEKCPQQASVAHD